MLTGYRVLDVGQFVAGPTCTRIMAELGAEVIKLELAPFGDRGRAAGDKPRDPRFKNGSQSTYYFQHNHSKKSLAIDIKQQRGRDLVRSLIPKIDVLVESFAPGAIARMGLGYDELKVINTRCCIANEPGKANTSSARCSTHTSTCTKSMYRRPRCVAHHSRPGAWARCIRTAVPPGCSAARAKNSLRSW
jgi:hypothetical protein